MSIHPRALPALLLLVVALAAPASASASASADSTGRRMVAVARVEAARHIREAPAGSDRGPQLARYFTAVHAREGIAWCAVFVSYVARRAGFPLGPHGSGFVGVGALTAWGARHGFFRSARRRPRVGDIALYGTAHVGLVARVTPHGRIFMIDGNWSNTVDYHPLYESPSGYLRLPTLRWGSLQHSAGT